MLRLSNISKDFGGVQAVSDVSMEVQQSEVRGLIGPNGAGKTTLINLISGLLKPSNGSMSLGGIDLSGKSTPARARMGIARTFQNLRVFSNLTVVQNIDVAQTSAAAAGRDTRQLVHSAIAEFGLGDHLHKDASVLAYGQLRRLEIVRALALGPRVLLLDEPAAGMNEAETDALSQSLTWVGGHSDCAIVVIDHDLKFIMTLCDTITVMNMGATIAEGSPESVGKDRAVIEAYLGNDFSEAVDAA